MEIDKNFNQKSLPQNESRVEDLRAATFPPSAKELEDLQREYSKINTEWDPLADGKLRVMVIDNFNVKNGVNHGEVVANYVKGDIVDPRVEFAPTASSADLSQTVKAIEEGKMPRPEALNISLKPNAPEEVYTLKELNSLMGKTGKDLITTENFTEHAAEVRAFIRDPLNAEKTIAGFKLDNLNKEIENLEQIAILVDGPVTVAAGNDGADTFNPFSLLLADNPEHHSQVISVMASEPLSGEISDYSSKTGDVSYPVGADLVSFKTENGYATVETGSKDIQYFSQINPLLGQGVLGVPKESISSEKLITAEQLQGIMPSDLRDESWPSKLNAVNEKFLTKKELDELIGCFPNVETNEQPVHLAELKDLANAFPEDKAIKMSDLRSILEDKFTYNSTSYSIFFRGYEDHKLSDVRGDFNELKSQLGGTIDDNSRNQLYDISESMKWLAEEKFSSDPELQKIAQGMAKGNQGLYTTGHVIEEISKATSVKKLEEIMETLMSRPSGIDVFGEDPQGKVVFRPGDGRLFNKVEPSNGTSYAAPQFLNGLIRLEFEK